MSFEYLKPALEVAIEAAREAGKELKKHYGNIEVESKGGDGLEAGDGVVLVLSDQIR